MGNMYAFLSGFMFTAITVVLTQLLYSSIFLAQVALFFMAFFLDVFVLYMGESYMRIVYLCKHVPPYSGKPSLYNIMSNLSVMLGLGGTTILLFLASGLVFLAVTQLVVGTDCHSRLQNDIQTILSKDETMTCHVLLLRSVGKAFIVNRLVTRVLRCN